MQTIDLPRLVEIEKEGPSPLWTLQNFQTDLQAGDRVNLVATLKSQVVGFLIARLVSEIEPEEDCGRTSAGQTSTGPALPKRTLQLNLLHMAVTAEHHRSGVGRALLKQLERCLRKRGDRIRAAVPESNLPVQLLLRSLGYKAMRVLRGYYGSEDAYQMEWRRS
jgi:ribosomal-protein-alanine N-acetyltransferase